MNRIEALTEILPYVREFQGKSFVIKLGGELCTGAVLGNIAQQLSLIQHIGMRPIVVHGGGPQLDTLSARLGITPTKKAGRRVTDSQTLQAAIMTFCGEIATSITSSLGTQGVRAIGLSGADARLVRASKRPPLRVPSEGGKTELVDFGHVGNIEHIDTDLISSLLRDGIIPVISPIAADESGSLFNVNADTLAARVAQSLKAEKLILMSNVPGIMRNVSDPSSLISYADIDQVQNLAEEGIISAGMLPKVQACVDALKGGVRRAHIIDGTRPSSLLMELFLNQGVGTMIVESLAKQ